MLIEISDKVRIESHPPRKRAKATKELLDDAVTAKHYQACRPATKEEIKDGQIETIRAPDSGEYIRIFRDAHGRPVEVGKQMDYIDWKCPRDARVWTVYQIKVDPEHPLVEKDEDGNTVELPRFMPVQTFDTKADAESFAASLED